MSDAERGEDAEYPTEGIAPRHRDWDVLQDKDDDHSKTAAYEVEEKGINLGVYVRLEQEGLHVSERHDRRGVKQEKKPDAFVGLVEHESEQDDKQDGNVGH